MKKLIYLILIIFFACNNKKNNTALATTNSDKDAVRKAIINNYDFINNNNLSDSLTFNRFKTFYSDSFVLGPSEGNPLSNKETILEEWRELFKENKATFDLKINRVEVSGNLAYVLYHYNEKLTNIETGDLYFEVIQSAIAILKKDSFGNWKFEVLRWN
ncbi:YybH family protein [Pontimicrobium aquaticum]|uniref:Nuclear transport factor 2 family protein n=1 Tax=Pontimicrobium aquaticum TaxID=2565367 RepID=A0A4U0EVV1_9FLAO|nr:nuclear transport factor 2 family protein [Pontimicrobium aquaticum]TJY35878.1 nuclear transport factor 2 family protein [Pontimicrobium aquaticum]